MDSAPPPLLTGLSVRLAARANALDAYNTTSGLAPGHVQANLVALDAAYAEDFAAFCAANPKPCPLLDRTASGSREVKVAPGSDLATDVPRYREWTRGVAAAADVPDVSGRWTATTVGFLLGCSFSWESLLAEAGCVPRHVEERCNVPMFNTNIALAAVGPFGGTMVVSMRPYAPGKVETVRRITARFPLAHGAPIHVGDPAEIGISDVAAPDYGDAVTVNAGEVCCFWACGVTPQVVLAEAKLPFAITHSPGHMFLCDTKTLTVEEVLS